MYTTIQVPDRRFSAFYEDNSLLVQFILEEFIQSHQLTLQIKTITQEQFNHQKLDSWLSSLILNFRQLIGHFPEIGRSSPSCWIKGSLTKFKEYCEHFSLNSIHQKKYHRSLYMAAHQTWLIAVHNLELCNSLYLHAYFPNSDSPLYLLPLKRSLHTFHMRFNQIIRYLPKILIEYWNNENVILYLLRKKDLLTKIYGPDFLYKRFKWPMTTSELIDLLVKSYQSRGFETLLPTIQQLLVEENKALNP